jgi:hypothetical protein
VWRAIDGCRSVAVATHRYAGQLKYGVRVNLFSLAYFVFPACRGRPQRGLLGWKPKHYDGVGRATVPLRGGRSGGDSVPVIRMLVERRTTTRQVLFYHLTKRNGRERLTNIRFLVIFSHDDKMSRNS